MEKKDKNILKKGLMETKSDFTSNLMDQINAEEKALSNVLSSDGKLETSPDFTALLMEKLEGKSPALVYKPVISKKVWYALAAVFVGVVGLVVFFGSTGSEKAHFDIDFSKVASEFGALSEMGSTVAYAIFGVLVFSVGLVVEQRISRRRYTVTDGQDEA